MHGYGTLVKSKLQLI